MRLGARIWDLRHKDGVRIRKETKTSKNRYGEATRFASYILTED